MEKRFKLLPPIMPTVARFEKESQLRQDGFKVDEGFLVKYFSREEAEEYAELMRTEFLKHWEKLQK